MKKRGGLRSSTSRVASCVPSISILKEYRCSGLGSGEMLQPPRVTAGWLTLCFPLSW